MFLILSLAIFCLAAIDSYAATSTVTKTADTDDGVCDTDCSLREAVFAAAPGDTIVFSLLFNSPQTISLTAGQITINGDLTITGPGRSLLTVHGVLGEKGLGRLFITRSNNAISMSNMTLTGGCACGVGNTEGDDAWGGAISAGSVDLRLENMSFTYNRAYWRTANGTFWTGYGGAVLARNVTLINCEFYGNYSVVSGGAIYAGGVDVTDSQISQNAGGFVLYSYNGPINVHHSALSHNHSDGFSYEGGAIAGGDINVYNSIFSDNDWSIYGSSIHVENSTFINMDSDRNQGSTIEVVQGGVGVVQVSVIANHDGPGIWNQGTLSILNTAVTGNKTGIITKGGNLFVTNSTVSGNVRLFSNVNSGGIDCQPDHNGNGARVVMTNSTIADNEGAAGGGVYSCPNCSLTLQNSIVADNTSSQGVPDISGAVISRGSNLIGNTTGSSGWIAGDLLNANALLAPLGNNGGSTFTHALLPGSPAINAGNNSLAIDPLTMLPLTQDQRGRSRFVGGRMPTVDIGAYEASYSPSPVTVSGRITTYSGRGIERTRIRIDDGQGNVFYTQTNPFGYYRLINLIPGTTYTITITNKLYLFTSPQFFTADEDRDDLNFITGF